MNKRKQKSENKKDNNMDKIMGNAMNIMNNNNLKEVNNIDHF